MRLKDMTTKEAIRHHLLETPPIEYEYDLIPTPAENFPYELIVPTA